MSIKRRSTGNARPAAKGGPPSARGRVELLPAAKMVPGTEYVGWLCRNKACGLLIAIADSSTDDASTEPKRSARAVNETPVIQCPHCQNEDLYRWDARGRRPYVPKN